MGKGQLAWQATWWILSDTVKQWPHDMMIVHVARISWCKQLLPLILKNLKGRDCRNVPGTISAGLAQDLGLVHKEVTLVMTDVQASSKLWEW